MRQWLPKWGYWIPASAAILATLGDFVQLWVVNAARPELFLSGPPGNAIVFATLAGSLGIPVYGVGYCLRAYQAHELQPNNAVLLATAGVAFAVLGGIVHAVTGVTIANEVGNLANGLAPLEGILASGPIVLVLWILAAVSLLAVGLADLSLSQQRFERLFNPLVLTLIITVLAALLASPWNDFVGPAAVNIAHILFFFRLAVR